MLIIRWFRKYQVSIFCYEKQKSSQVHTNIDHTATVGAQRREMYGNLRMTIVKSFQLRVVEDAELREFSRHNIHFSRKIVRTIIFALSNLLRKGSHMKYKIMETHFYVTSDKRCYASLRVICMLFNGKKISINKTMKNIHKTRSLFCMWVLFHVTI